MEGGLVLNYCSSIATDHLEPPPNGACYVDRLPDEIVLKVSLSLNCRSVILEKKTLQIFSNLYEADLARCAGVSGRFYRISNDANLW